MVLVPQRKMNKQIRVGVIGSGIQGKNHLRVYNKIRDVEVVGYQDKKYIFSNATKDFQFFSSLDQIVKNNIDAVSICTPANTHEKICKFFLESNIHCLVEKPFGTNIEECKKLAKLAKKKKKVLMVGHIERFNPAVIQLKKIIKKISPKILEFKRLNSVSKRIKDVNIINDLMIHDIDIMNNILNKKIKTIDAFNVGKNKLIDHIVVVVKFKDNTLCMLTASKITKKPVRTLHITSDQAFIELDFNKQSIDIFHKTRSLDNIKNNSVDEYGKYDLEIALERPFIRMEEPLFLELKHFKNCILGKEQLLISPEEAIRAMEIAKKIFQILKS